MPYFIRSSQNSPITRARRRWLQPVQLVLVGLLALTLWPAAAPAQAQTVPFTPTPCPIAPIEGLTTDCGYLTVPESRSNYTGKTIRLAVAILRSPNPNRAPDPMVFLAGGPGQGTLPLAALVVAGYAPTLAQRDIILIDQRGTGYSQPNLSCPIPMQTLGKRLPFNVATDDRPAFIQAQVDFLVACGNAFRAAGIDLRAYNSAENSADLEDLRRALGYDQWNLVGGSYGTRLALTSMRYRPETIRSAVLDSVYPLQANFHTEVFSSFQNSLNSLFAQCAADAACNAAYPKLDHAYDSVVARLNANPAQVPIIDPQTEQIVTYLPVSGVDFSLLMFQLSYSTPVIPILPLVIAATNNGNYELLGVLFGLLLSASGEDPAAFSFGMQVAVQCNEDATFASSRDFVAARDKNRRASPLAHIITFNEAYLDVCAAWGLTNPEPGANFRVESDRPTLIIGGTNDPITPPNYAASAAETLSRSTTVLYPRGGHTPSAISPCLARIVAAFHNDPNQRPDSSCVAAEAPLPFVTPAARSATVKIPVTTDAFGKTKTLRLSNIKALVKPASKAKAKPAATTSRTTSARNTTKAAR